MSSERIENNTSKEELIIRNHLAGDRTHLANERTLLAYWRTALAFAILGPVIIRFSPTTFVEVLGNIFLVFGVGLVIHGTLRYYKMKKRINKRLN